MYAYYELETEIPVNHQLMLQLPNHIPAGHARVAIIYEKVETPNAEAETWKQDLLSISQWDISEKDVAVSSWKIESF
jgi:hypothetical protein